MIYREHCSTTPEEFDAMVSDRDDVIEDAGRLIIMAINQIANYRWLLNCPEEHATIDMLNQFIHDNNLYHLEQK